MITYFPKPLNKQVAAISDSLTRTQKGLGIGASGDTHAAIGSGQFVYVKDHSSLAEGLYKSKAAIAQNGALSTSNLTADGSGGLNDLQSQITSLSSNLTNLNKRLLCNLGNKTDADLDAMTTAGIYYIWVVNASTSPGKNQWCFLIVASPSTGYCSQAMITTQASCKIGSRYMKNGTWSNWFTT